MATELFGAYNTADVLIDSTSGSAGTTSLYNLANAAYAYSGEIDNSAGHYTYGDVELAMSTTVTLASPGYLGIYLLPNVGSGNYAAASGAPGAAYLVGSAQLATSGTVQFVQVRGILLTPNKFKIVALNNLGSALPSNTLSTLKLYRYALTVA